MRQHIITGLRILMFSAVLICGSAWSEDAPLYGVMMVVKGDIKIIHVSNKIDVAKVGSKVIPGDSIQSGPDSRAKIVMSDKNVLNISPDSKIKIEKYTNTGVSKNVEIKVEFGKIRASVEQKYDGEKSTFNVKTPSAVAGVRGTDFLTSYSVQTKASQIITFSGTVAVGQPGAGGKILNPVFVQPGQMTNATEGKKIEPPRAVPPEELKQIKMETSAAPGPKETPNSKDQPATKDTKDSKDKDPKDKASADGKDDGGRKPASAGSMIDSKDLGPDLGKDVTISAPLPSAPAGFLQPGLRPPPIPSQFLNDASRNQKAKTTIIINN